MINQDDIIDLRHTSSLPKCMSSSHSHLVKLYIYQIGLSDDWLKAFQNLPNLLELVLGMEIYNGMQLQIRHFYGSNSLIIDKEALYLLEKLNIEHCPQLKKLPSGVKHPRNNSGFPDLISVNCLLGLGLGELLSGVNNIDLCILYRIQKKKIDVCFGGQENQRKKIYRFIFYFLVTFFFLLATLKLRNFLWGFFLFKCWYGFFKMLIKYFYFISLVMCVSTAKWAFY